MTPSHNNMDSGLLTVPVGRRTALSLCARGALGLWVVLGTGAFLGLLGSLAGCRRAPGTAREQLIFISEEKEIAMGIDAFRSVLKQARLNQDPEITAMVNRVGRRIADAARKPEYQWEFAVIQDDETINAFALPGGKVAVFTGLLEYTKNEAGLATVMGHEIAHALQHHGAERYSRGWLEMFGQVVAMGAVASGAVDPAAAQGVLSAYGVGVSLPFNRKQELEADFIGLRLMAKAGYDPREAIPFWERMSGCPRNMLGKLCFRSTRAVPEFLSTHPSDVTRMNQIDAWIPGAMRFYHPTAATPGQAPVPPHERGVGAVPGAAGLGLND